MSRDRSANTKRPPSPQTWPPEWPVSGSTANLILVGLILVSDHSGAHVATQAQLAKFGDRCVETARSAIEKLRRANCLSVEPTNRGQGGTFGTKLYQLNLSNELVFRMFELLRRRPDAGEIALAHPDFPNPNFSSGEVKRRRKTPPYPQETGHGAYIDTRAYARASSNFIFSHSLPADFQIDEEFRSLVEKVLSVCGVGLDDVRKPGLLESLVECLPEALDDGYDFDLDILPCVKRKTSAHRVERLWSFRVIFKNDLPEWKQNRLAKEQRRKSGSLPVRRVGYEKELNPKSDSLDALLSKAPVEDNVASRISSLRRTLAQLEDPNPADWVLPQALRNLDGEERALAISRERADVLAKLSALNAVQSPQL